MKQNQGDFVRRYLFFYVSSFIYKENHVLIEEYNHSEKIVIVEEELHGIDAGNLGDLLRLVFIDEKCGNPKAVVDGGDLTRNITQKKKPGILQACRSLLEMLQARVFLQLASGLLRIS